MDMSFREKSAWACLVTTGVVFIPYFTFIFQLASKGELILPRVIVAFVAAVLAQIVQLRLHDGHCLKHPPGAKRRARSCN